MRVLYAPGVVLEVCVWCSYAVRLIVDVAYASLTVGPDRLPLHCALASSMPHHLSGPPVAMTLTSAHISAQHFTVPNIWNRQLQSFQTVVIELYIYSFCPDPTVPFAETDACMAQSIQSQPPLARRHRPHHHLGKQHPQRARPWL